MHLGVRIVGTVLVVGLLCRPLWAPQWGPGPLSEIHGVSAVERLMGLGGFLALVALYCHTLQSTMRRSGAGRSSSVWWMFAFPANFVEDFYIVQRVAQALDLRLDQWPRGSWLALGHGWCAFQLVSLLPGLIGLVGGAVAVALWLAHWVLTLMINHEIR